MTKMHSHDVVENIRTRDDSLWGNLAGPPMRLSPAISVSKGKTYDGWVKLRLCHGRGRTYFLPDVLVGFEGSKFYLPSFFGPPQLSFNIPNPFGWKTRRHSASFSVDVAAPKGDKAVRLEISIYSDGHVLSYDDGAQLYRCKYAGPVNTPLAPLVAGNCTRMSNGDFALEVFHHTTKETAAKIMSSGELWSGQWNLAGTSKLSNVAYTYFTTLPRIGDEADLHRIAMSSAGSIFYQTTSDRPVENVLDLPVYRSDIAARTTALTFRVPSQIVAPAHILFHPYVHPNPAYYEIVGSEIVRVAMKPGANLPFVDKKAAPSASDLKRFDYVVEGDASTKAGLEAPMREETTDEIAHLEKLDRGLDIFEYWLKHANTDQFAGRSFEARKIE